MNWLRPPSESISVSDSMLYTLNLHAVSADSVMMIAWLVEVDRDEMLIL